MNLICVNHYWESIEHCFSISFSDIDRVFFGDIFTRLDHGILVVQLHHSGTHLRPSALLALSTQWRNYRNRLIGVQS